MEQTALAVSPSAFLRQLSTDTETAPMSVVATTVKAWIVAATNSPQKTCAQPTLVITSRHANSMSAVATTHKAYADCGNKSPRKVYMPVVATAHKAYANRGNNSPHSQRLLWKQHTKPMQIVATSRQAKYICQWWQQHTKPMPTVATIRHTKYMPDVATTHSLCG